MIYNAKGALFVLNLFTASGSKRLKLNGIGILFLYPVEYGPNRKFVLDLFKEVAPRPGARVGLDSAVIPNFRNPPSKESQMRL